MKHVLKRTFLLIYERAKHLAEVNREKSKKCESCGAPTSHLSSEFNEIMILGRYAMERSKYIMGHAQPFQRPCTAEKMRGCTKVSV